MGASRRHHRDIHRRARRPGGRGVLPDPVTPVARSWSASTLPGYGRAVPGMMGC